VDVIHFGSPEMEALHREKILQPVASPYFKDLIPGAVPRHREWVATILSVWVQAYNTNLIKKEDLPRGYRDLLDPKWKGKFAIEPAVARSNAIGIARRAPHPDAALLFYDYMITEAQQYFVSLDYVPTNASVPSPLKDIRFKLVDPVQVLDQMDKWTQLYQEV